MKQEVVGIGDEDLPAKFDLGIHSDSSAGVPEGQ
jgi:hypothetical protein